MVATAGSVCQICGLDRKAQACKMTLSELELKRLIHQLQNSEPAARADAAEALGRSSDPGAIEALIQALSDEASDVAWAATEALTALGPMTVEALCEAAARAEDAALARITEALGDLADVRSQGLLLSQLSHADWAVRHAAAKGLAGMGRPAAEAICARLSELSEPGQLAAVEALGQLGDPTSVASLANLLDDEEHAANVRRAAIHALGQIGGPSSVDGLILALEADPAPEVRDAARVAIDRLVVRDADTWRAALELIGDPGRRLWWFVWAHRQRVPWLGVAIERAMADDAYVDGLGTFQRWRYLRGLKRLMRSSFGIAPPSRTWRWPEATLPEPGTTAQIPLGSRYGVLRAPGLVTRWFGGDDPESAPRYEHEAIGYLEVSAAQATLFLKDTLAWSLDLTRPLRVHAYADRTDAAQTEPPIASVHVVLRQAPEHPQGSWVEAGLSLHVLDDDALDALPRLRQSFPYIPDDRAEELLAWIAAWNPRTAL